MKSTKKANFLLTLSLVILFPISFSYGGAFEDPTPAANLIDQAAYYNYMDSGVVSNSGAYFTAGVAVEIVPGGFLLDDNDVLEIKVKHLETELEYYLSPDPCTNFSGLNRHYWSLFLRPSSWMFQGTWRFTMLYRDSTGYKNKQSIDAVPGPEVFPTVPSDIQILKTIGSITISWSAIGNPLTSPKEYDYRIRVYDGDCPVNWGWTYNLI